MYSAYDENNKQWGTLDVDRFIKSEESYGQKLLDVLEKHGSKVAQVFHTHIIVLTLGQICTFSLLIDFLLDK